MNFAEALSIIEARKAQYPALAGLSSPSATAIHRLWSEVSAHMAALQSDVFDLHREEMQQIVRQSIAFPAGWYVDRMLSFQYGDTIQYDPATYSLYYAVPDESKRIVKYVAIQTQGNRGVIKVAKDAGGAPQQLSGAEISALRLYLRSIQMPGAQIDVISLPGDPILLSATVYYNGQASLQLVRSAVEQAVETYLASLNFKGFWLRNTMIDSMQRVDNVVDVTIEEINTLAGAQLVGMGRIYYPLSGYFVISPSSPLSSAITYVPV